MKSALELQVSQKKQSEVNESHPELEQRIRMRAYELYEQRNRGYGHDVEDWLDAEAELRGKAKEQTKAVAA
jgi:DUF2934 family protein